MLTGIPKAVHKNRETKQPISEQKAELLLNCAVLLPKVFTILSPPKRVPKNIINATNTDMSDFDKKSPDVAAKPNNAMQIPVNFCPSCAP